MWENILIILVLLLLSACAERQIEKPMVNTDELLEKARQEVEATARLGPKPITETEEYKKAQKEKGIKYNSRRNSKFYWRGY